MKPGDMAVFNSVSDPNHPWNGKVVVIVGRTPRMSATTPVYTVILDGKINHISCDRLSEVKGNGR